MQKEERTLNHTKYTCSRERSHLHTACWQMVIREVDGAVKQTCSLCPPTQRFTQSVYQMAALYQGVAATGSSQSSFKQENCRPSN